MYETLAILKRDTPFSVDDMETLLGGICDSGNRTLQRNGSSFSITTGQSQLHVAFSDQPYVADECNELADHFKVPCAGCVSRYEIAGDDPAMEIFNDYLFITDRLQETGQFILFDPNEGKMLLADSVLDTINDDRRSLGSSPAKVALKKALVPSPEPHGEDWLVYQTDPWFVTYSTSEKSYSIHRGTSSETFAAMEGLAAHLNGG